MTEKDLGNGPKLKAWLAVNRLQNGDIADHLKCHVQTITNYIRGKSFPPYWTARVIESYTNGEIKADGWKR